MNGVIHMLETRIKYLLKNNPPTGDEADRTTQAMVTELKTALNFVKALKEGDGESFGVYEIKLEIARRIERIKAFNPSDFSDESATHNRGVASGLDALWKWIQQSEEA